MRLQNKLAVPVNRGDVGRAWVQFRHVLYDQKLAMVGAGALALGLTALELVRPWPVKWVIDALTTVADPEAAGTALSGISDRSLVVFAAMAFFVPAAIGGVTERLQIAVAKISRKATVRIRTDVFRHLHRIELTEHQRRQTGDLLMRIMGDVNMVRDLLFSSWLNIMSRGTVLIGAAVIFAIIDWRLFLLALVPIPLLWVGVKTASKKVKSAAGKQRRKEGSIAANVAEALRHIDLTKAFGAEKRTTEKFTRDARGAERATMAATRHAARLARTTEVLTGAGVGLVLAFGAFKVRAGLLTPGELLVTMSYTRMMYKPIRKLTGEAARLAKATACAARVLDVLDLPVEGPRGGVKAPRLRGELVFDDVHHRYHDKRQSLRGLSVRLPAGGFVVVTGDNGSGKSTLLALLMRLYKPSSGEILVDGHPIESFKLASYRSQIAYVPQQLSLFSGSIRDNILYGKPEATEQEVEAAALVARFDTVIDGLPDGYDTVLDEDGQSLSGGEARRLMLARAALRDAPILLLDEPLSGLDTTSREEVIGAIASLAEGRTALVVHHGDPQELGAGFQLHLEDGKLHLEVEQLEERRTA